MERNDQELFENVHGIFELKLEKAKGELEARKISHQDYLHHLETKPSSSRGGVGEKLERQFNFFRNHQLKTKNILEKYKKYLVD